MTPGLDVRLQSLLKSLEQIVLPAISPADKNATEQGRIAIAQLKTIAAQWPYAARMSFSEFKSMRRLATELATYVPTEARTVLMDALSATNTVERDDPFAVQEATRRIGLCIDAILLSPDLEADSDAARRRLVLDHADRQVRLERSWFVSTGFIADKATPTIAQLLDDLSAAQDEPTAPDKGAPE